MPKRSYHHQFDFIEIPATDLKAAKKFYGKAFGWTFQDWGDDYADIQGAGVSGGLRKVDAAPARGGTLAILYSTDLPASEKAVTKAGGKITERHEFPGGRRFHFVDPSGAELAVWTKVKAKGAH
jgi:predicted enzyme related to lactoylglutathione lyase